jgi:hypothetical protein
MTTEIESASSSRSAQRGQHALRGLAGEDLQVHSPAPVALHQPDGGEHLLGGGGEVALAPALGLGGDLDLAGVVVGHHGQHRDHDHRHEGHLPGLVQQEREAAHEHHQAAHDVADRLDDEVLDDEHVTGDPGEHVTGAPLVVVAEWQPLEVGVHRDPDGVAERPASASHGHLGQRVRRAVDSGDKHDREREQQDGLVACRGDQVRAADVPQGGPGALQVVDEVGDRQRLEHRARRLERQQQDAGHVGLRTPHEPAEQPHRSAEVTRRRPLLGLDGLVGERHATSSVNLVRHPCASVASASTIGERGARAKVRSALRSRATASCQRIRATSTRRPRASR